MNLKTIASRLAATTIILVALGFVLNLLVDNPYSHKIVRDIVNEKLSDIPQIKVDFQAIDISAFPLEAKFYGFQVAAPESSEIPLVSAANVKVRVSIPSLILGTPKLSLVELTELKVNYPPAKPLDLGSADISLCSALKPLSMV